MADESWRTCEGTWDRLAWARAKRHPGATKKDVALTLGVAPGTYNAYERAPGSSKWIPLNHEHAFYFAKKLKVRWEWLLLGQGEPWLNAGDQAPSAKDRAKKAIDAATEDQAEAVATLIERMLKTGTES